MEFPKQIQAQLEAVEAYDRELLAQQEPPEAEAPESEAEISEEVQPAPEPVEPAPAPEPRPQPEVSEETWQHKYRTLQSKYDKEIPRQNAELRDLRAKLEVATSQIAELSKRQQAEPKPNQKLVTDQDVETFGSDLIDVIDRKAREVAASQVEELRAENARLLEQLNGVTERQSSNERDVFFSRLEAQVPEWEAINVDEGFLGWLAETDPLSGVTRQDYLTTAYSQFDVQRTAALFNAFKQTIAPPPSAPAPRPLERHVAPGTSKSSTPAPDSAATRIWSTQEVERLYRDASQGKIAEADWVRIEAQIDAAVAEGRIR